MANLKYLENLLHSSVMISEKLFAKDWHLVHQTVQQQLVMLMLYIKRMLGEEFFLQTFSLEKTELQET